MKKFKLAIVALCLSSLCMFCCNMYAADYDSNSKVHFKNIILPDACENTTFISTPKGGKATSRSYGKVKISSYSHCDSVDFWLRSKYDGNWHYWTPYVVKNISDKKSHKVKYCDASSAYYKKGITAQLRGENAKSSIALFNNAKVSGNVWFN